MKTGEICQTDFFRQGFENLTCTVYTKDQSVLVPTYEEVDILIVRITKTKLDPCSFQFLPSSALLERVPCKIEEAFKTLSVASLGKSGKGEMQEKEIFYK